MIETYKKIDTNGWLEIKGNPISKVGVFEYSGAQIDPEGKHGLDPNGRYGVLRPAEELSDEACIESFKLVPWIDDHVMLGRVADGLMPPEYKGVSGVVGEDVYFEDGYLKANIKVFSEQLASLIAQGKRELSIGYYSEYDFTPGVYNGRSYVAVQRDIRGNHLALVGEGRSGRDVAVFDHFNFTLDESLNVDKKDIETKDADVVEASDAEGDAAQEGGHTIADIVSALKEIAPLLGAVKEALGQLSPVQAEPDGDEGEQAEQDGANAPADAPVAMDGGATPAMDAALKKIKSLATEVESLKKNGVKALMSHINDRDRLADQLSEHVGVFDHADKTLDEVAEYGVQKLKLACKKGEEITALRAYFAGRKADGGALFTVDSAEKTKSSALDAIKNGGIE